MAMATRPRSATALAAAWARRATRSARSGAAVSASGS